MPYPYKPSFPDNPTSVAIANALNKRMEKYLSTAKDKYPKKAEDKPCQQK